MRFPVSLSSYRMNPSENWASCFEAHKPGSSCLTRFHFRSGIHFVSNFLPTEPRGPAVVFNSWLPSEGPTADFHRQANHHVQRTPIPLRSIGPMAGIVGVLSF